LTGQFSFAFTNADIQLVGPKARALLTPIALVLRLNELTKSPVNWLAANGAMGGGKVNLNKFTLVSAAFTADTMGEIPLATVLTNSPINNWPVNFALRRSLADKANLIPKNAPTNTPYVLLPNFVKVGGTIGDPKTHTDELVILQLVGKSVAGLPGAVGEKAGQVIEGAGGVVKGLAAFWRCEINQLQCGLHQQGWHQPTRQAGSVGFPNQPKK